MSEQAQLTAKAVPAIAPVHGPVLQRQCACGQHAAGGECEECRKKAEGTLQRAAVSPGSVGSVPPIVHDVLRSSGKPLDPATRAFMEPRFGHDFSHVRVHTDARAAESARVVNALAYTVGRNVVFGTGQHAPESTAGKRLMAHELTHVVQQSDHIGQQAGLHLGAPSSPAENEAATVATQINAGGSVGVHHRVSTATLNRLTCEELMNAQEAARVSGKAAHSAISADFETKVGAAKAFPIRSIPGASFSQQRLECGDDSATTSVRSRTPYSGNVGYPDIAYSNSSNDVELAEVKFAHMTCVPEGLAQVENYKNVGNKTRKWREDAGIGKLQIMPQGRYTPGPTVDVEGEPVSVTWCRSGLIMYKAVRDQDPEIFLCSSLSDKGKLTQFLDRTLGRAQGEVDRYFNDVLDPAMTRAINSISVSDAVKYLYRYARTELLTYLKSNRGMLLGPVLDNIPEEVVVSQIAQLLEQQLKGVAEQELRKLLLLIKQRLLDRVRALIKTRLRDYLQESLTALCAAATTITIAKLLQQLWQDMAKYFGRVAGEVLVQVAKEIMAEMAEALKPLAPLAILAAIIVAILLLPEEVILAIGAALAALARFLISQLPKLASGLIPSWATNAIPPDTSTLPAGVESTTPVAGEAVV